MDSPAGFARWVGRLLREADTPVPPPAGRVHSTYWWITEGDSYLGAISLRHELNDSLLDHALSPADDMPTGWRSALR